MELSQLKYYTTNGKFEILDSKSSSIKSFSVNSEGFLHSYDDKPSLIYGDVTFWDYNGYSHRLNGPAMIDSSVVYYSLRYFIHGKEYKNKNEWEIEVNRIKTLEEI